MEKRGQEKVQEVMAKSEVFMPLKRERPLPASTEECLGQMTLARSWPTF